MWKFLVLFILTHNIYIATSKDLYSGCGCKTIDEQEINEDESNSYVSPCHASCQNEDDDDSDESNENNDGCENDYNKCRCKPETTANYAAQCNGAVGRAMRALFDCTVKLSFSVLPQMDPSRPYYLASFIPIYYTLGSFSKFTIDQTLQQILNVIDLSSDEVNCVFGVMNAMMAQIQNSADFRVVENGTYVFANARYPLTSNFVNTLERVFVVPTTNINFVDYIQALNDMNGFVRQYTDGQDISISEVFYGGLIALLQLEPLYFKNTWENGCLLGQYRDNFYADACSIVPDVCYVRRVQCCKTGYSEYFQSTMLEIDLQQGFKFVGIPIDSDVDIDEVINKLNWESFMRERRRMKCKLVDVSLANLTPTLTKFDVVNATQRTVGRMRLYNYNEAQIRGVAVGDPQLSITHGLQSIYWQTLINSEEQCPANLPQPEETVKGDRRMLVIIIRDNLTYMALRLDNIPADPVEYLRKDIIGY